LLFYLSVLQPLPSMVHGGTAMSNNDRQIYTALLDDFTVDTVAIGNASTLDLTGYDLVLMSETPGSSDADNNFTAYDQIPVVSLKSYAFQKSNITWLSTVDDVARFKAASAADELGSNEDVPAVTELEILVDHDVFTEVGKAGDKFSFATENYGDLTGGHFQAMDFTNSANNDIATSATDLASSVWVTEQLTGWDFNTIIAAVEANAACQNLVVFGIHSNYVLSDACLKAIRNAVYWVVDMENPYKTGVNLNAVSPFAVYPNPVRDFMNVNNAADIASVEIIDITGKIVSSKENTGMNTMRVSTSELESGIYLVRINTIDGKVFADKIIK